MTVNLFALSECNSLACVNEKTLTTKQLLQVTPASVQCENLNKFNKACVLGEKAKEVVTA